MIHVALDRVVREINAYLALRSPGPQDRVVADSLFDLTTATPNGNALDHVVAQVVNIEENSVYRSVETHRTRQDGVHERLKPEVRLNLYVLFVANIDDYLEALKALSLVIAFFQNRFVFTIAGNGDGASRVVFELYSLTFEQQNHLWASLGAKYMPSVLYKASIVQIRDAQVEAETPPVEEVLTRS